MQSLKNIQFWFSILVWILTAITLFFAGKTGLFLLHAEPQIGVVSDIREATSDNGSTYLPTVEFEFNGQNYSFESNAGTGNKNTYKRGNELEILVNAKNPASARINTTWEVWAGAIVFGSIALIGWLAMLLLARDIRKRRKFIARMKKEGIKVDATIVDIREEHIRASNSGVTVTRTVYRADAKGLFEGSERLFTSDRIQIDPRGFGVKIGDKVPVYVDPKKKKKTYMDFDHVPGGKSFY